MASTACEVGVLDEGWADVDASALDDPLRRREGSSREKRKRDEDIVDIVVWMGWGEGGR